VIAVDANLLVYAHREDHPWSGRASACVRELAEGAGPWAIPWPCLHEFLAIVTHLRIFAPPTPVDRALDQMAAWLESPTLVLLGETRGYFSVLADVVGRGRASGPLVHDARVAALCVLHNVDVLWTADRDFGRFPMVKTRNPLVG
jgi:toxin-antitoxin system PIN domain toxin